MFLDKNYDWEDWESLTDRIFTGVLKNRKYEVALPGYSKEDMKVRIENDKLYIETKDGKYYTSYYLPTDTKEVKCDMKNGLFTFELITTKKDIIKLSF